MPFDYYYRLSRDDQQIYRLSDGRPDLPTDLSRAVRSHDWSDLLGGLEHALSQENRRSTEKAARALLDQLGDILGTPPVRCLVRAVRPSEDWGELHGLYTPAEGRAWAIVEVWMRTAHHKRIVAFRTFSRTLLHEFCHHLDYELFGLEDSFHTQGFFQREARLFRHLYSDRHELSVAEVPAASSQLSLPGVQP